MKKIIFTISTTLILTLSGCSVLQNPSKFFSSFKKEKTDTAKKQTITAKPKPDTKNATTPASKPKSVIYEKTGQKSAGKVDNKQSITAVTPSPAPKVETVEPIQADTVIGLSLSGEWLFQKVNSKNITGDDRPYIYFLPQRNEFYGYNGCNVFNGKMQSSPNNVLKLTDIAQSLRLCDKASDESYLISNALNEVARFAISTFGDESKLELLTSNGRVLMELRRHNLSFISGLWGVKSISGNEVEASDVKLVIDLTDHSIKGFAGCNVVTGELFVDPDRPNSVQFQNLHTTNHKCALSGIENQLLVALEEAVSCHRLPDGELVLRSFKGDDVVIFIPLEK